MATSLNRNEMRIVFVEKMRDREIGIGYFNIIGESDRFLLVDIQIGQSRG